MRASALIGAEGSCGTDASPEVKFAFAVLLALLLSFRLSHARPDPAGPTFTLLRGLPARWPLVPFT